jgi:hypothetical protein
MLAGILKLWDRMTGNPGDRAAWDQAWRAMTKRRLPNECQITLNQFDALKPFEISISANPPHYADRMPRESDQCPICGQSTANAPRLPCSLALDLASGGAIALGVWTHTDCFEHCEDTGVSAGVPW